ncbi:MAG TPA: amino acid racemase [Gaiellaceae bacterium]|nr:amino acid racemase [Gaiellaceae bacterium]
MRTIGLLGGMTWHSTIEYYRLVNTLANGRRGGAHSARCVIVSVDQAAIEPLMEAGRWEDAGRLLAEDAATLERAGADVFVLACNSLHNAWETIVAPLTIPTIHIGDATADALPAVGRVALLGTRYTMEAPFLRERIEARGIDVVIPEVDDRAEIHRSIFDELSGGVVRPETRTWFQDLVARLDTDAVVLGCGELGLLQLDGALVDTVRAHAQAAVDYALYDV